MPRTKSEFIADKPGQAKAGDDQNGADDEGGCGRHGAGGQGAFAFDGVFPIVFAVPVVVDDIDAAGDKGEGDEALEDLDQLVDIVELTAKNNGKKQEHIFCPILWS